MQPSFEGVPNLQGMNPEGQSIKPGDEDEDGSKDIDSEDINSDKTTRLKVTKTK
jgi:hypothetical protein